MIDAETPPRLPVHNSKIFPYIQNISLPDISPQFENTPCKSVYHNPTDIFFDIPSFQGVKGNNNIEWAQEANESNYSSPPKATVGDISPFKSEASPAQFL